MEQKEKATERLNLRTTPKLKKQLEEEAKRERRSLNNLIVTVMEDYIKEKEAKRDGE